MVSGRLGAKGWEKITMSVEEERKNRKGPMRDEICPLFTEVFGLMFPFYARSLDRIVSVLVIRASLVPIKAAMLSW